MDERQTAAVSEKFLSDQMVKLKRREFTKKYSGIVVLAVLLLFNGIVTTNFFAPMSLWNIVIQSCTVVMTGLGMTFVIASGGIDISVGAVMAMGAMVSSLTLPLGVPIAILCGGIAGLLTGFVTGGIISAFKLQPIVVTLAMSIAVRGLALMLNNGNLVYLKNAAFSNISLGRIGGIPYQFFYVVVLFVIFYFVAAKTSFGRYVEAMGDNPSAARLSGINTNKITMIVYGISGLMAGLAGVLMAAKTSSCDANGIGKLAELDAIAAVAIGGTSLTGGKPNIWGTVVGALIMQVIVMTVVMNNVRTEYAQVIKACIIIFAVFIQRDRTSK